ncbi:MAG: DUF6265 family protein [Sphingomonas sp.]
MLRMMIAGAALLCTGAAQESGLGWMSGGWCTGVEAGVQTCEVWSDETVGAIAGRSRTTKNGAVVSEERMAIGMVEGTLTFIAKPADAAEPTRFPLVSRGATEFVFENRAHDYPQRIRYWREGDVLMAEISLADGSKPMRWRYLRVKP